MVCSVGVVTTALEAWHSDVYESDTLKGCVHCPPIHLGCKRKCSVVALVVRLYLLLPHGENPLCINHYSIVCSSLTLAI